MPYTTEPKGPVAKNLNKGYGSESVKTERSNLMSDNPVAKDASGGRGSWMSKHSQSKMGGGSPLMATESQLETFDKDGDGKPFEKEDMKILKSEKK